jgi:hypothetical protein
MFEQKIYDILCDVERYYAYTYRQLLIHIPAGSLRSQIIILSRIVVLVAF